MHVLPTMESTLIHFYLPNVKEKKGREIHFDLSTFQRQTCLSVITKLLTKESQPTLSSYSLKYTNRNLSSVPAGNPKLEKQSGAPVLNLAQRVFKNLEITH